MIDEMKISNKQALDLHEEISARVEETCGHLLSSLGLTHFAYNLFYPGNTYVVLINSHHVDGLNSFFESDLDRHLIGNDFLPLPQGRMYVLWNSLPNNPIIENLKLYNIANGLTVSEKIGDVVECYNFGATLENVDKINLYINNKNLIDQFILYFKNQLDYILGPEKKFPTFQYRDGFSLDKDKICRMHENDFSEFRTLVELNRYKVVMNGIHRTLTKRQMDVLHLTAKGRTAKEIGRHLDLSYRTVEHYTNEIKLNFNLTTRSDLIRLWEENPLLHALYI